MKNTVFDIKEKIEEYEKLNPFIKFFSFKKRMIYKFNTVYLIIK
jgi:hypothetical protein